MIALVGMLIFMVIIAVIFTAIQQVRLLNLKKELSLQSEKSANKEKLRENFRNEIAQFDPGEQMIDTHTELLTRQAFNSQVDQLIASYKTTNNLFSLIMIKLLPSKSMTAQNQAINRHVLIEAAHRIKNTIRDKDTACHYEKDCFLVLFTKMIKPELVVHGVERIINELHRPYSSSNNSLEVKIHAGITIYPFDGEDFVSLIANTTATLDKIKTSENSLFQFFQEETQVLGERELNLKSVLKNPDLFNQVIFEYKPYFYTNSGEIACIHVVASLNHPELGKIPYDEFLRLAHYSSRLYELYEWMMKSAILKFSNSSEIKSTPKRFIFSFYLKQFEVPHFLDKIITIIKGLSSADNEIIMEIEDEEGLEGSHLEAFKKSIHALNESKIPISIGVLVLGHFALNKLNEVHFNYLKIDQRLVKDLGKRPESVAILEQIMMLAYVMQIETLTTGVKTEEQKNILENLGCHIIQGKLLDKQKSESLFIE